MPKPILYLMSKYSGRERESVKENRNAKRQLREKGFVCLNPIEHSHYEEENRKFECKYLMSNNCCNCECKTCDLMLPDYVADDLALLGAMCGPICNFGLIDGKPVMAPLRAELDTDGNPGWQDYKYQPHVVGVVLPSAYHIHDAFSKRQGLSDKTWIIWDSKGAEQEFRFMVEHHILVIPLAIALEKPIEEWEAAGL